MTMSERLCGFWIAVLGLLAGCARPELVVQPPDSPVELVASEIVAPALLASEVRAAASPQRIAAPIRFRNRSAVERRIALRTKGCSCYGVASESGPLREGDPVEIPAGGEMVLHFLAELDPAVREQSFRAAFEVLGSEAVPDLVVHCRQTIFPDLEVRPAVLFLTPAVSGSEQLHEIRVVSTYRESGSVTVPAPVVLEKPSYLELDKTQQVRAAVLVAAGLRASEWRFGFTIGSGAAPEIDSVPKQRIRFATVKSAASDREVADDGNITADCQVTIRNVRGIIGPRTVHFGQMAPDGAERTRRIVLSSASQTPFRILETKTPEEMSFAADSDQPAVQQWATLTFRPLRPGTVELKLAIATDHPDEREYLVTVRGVVE